MARPQAAHVCVMPYTLKGSRKPVQQACDECAPTKCLRIRGLCCQCVGICPRCLHMPGVTPRLTKINVMKKNTSVEIGAKPVLSELDDFGQKPGGIQV